MLITEKSTSNSLTEELDEVLIENENIFKIVSFIGIETLDSGNCSGCGCGYSQDISIRKKLKKNKNINIFRIISVNPPNCNANLNDFECGASCGGDPIEE